VNLVTPSSLAEYTRAGLILPCVRERDAAGIIGELSQLLQQEGIVPDFLPFYHVALNQELLVNPSIDCGIAFPHARLAAVKRLQFAFGRCQEKVQWGPKGSAPVEFIFLVAVPATEALSYLELLSSLARLGQQADLLDELRKAPDAETILEVLHKTSLRAG
jgi:mannitol/fructose-specific phosphotransferase system IIA component (Ntr-type)